MKRKTYSDGKGMFIGDRGHVYRPGPETELVAFDLSVDATRMEDENKIRVFIPEIQRSEIWNRDVLA